MATWYGTSRSNYVKLVDPEKSVAALTDVFDIEIHQDISNGLFTFFSTDFSGGTPSVWVDDGDDDITEFCNKYAPGNEYPDLLDVIHHFLSPEKDNVFVWVSAGAEKSRYITGDAIAIDHTGSVLNRISLSEIYEDTNWTHAEY